MPLFFDPKLVASPNFKFLPPIHPDGEIVANFEDIATPGTLTPTNVMTTVSSDILSDEEKLKLLFVKDDTSSDNLNEAENTVFNISEVESAFVNASLAATQAENKIGFVQNETINMINTSPMNNILCQVFEVDSRGDNKRLVKLDMFNAANFSFSEDFADTYGRELSQINNKHKAIYYIGKTFKDDLGVPTFIRLFTLMFD